MEMLAESLRPFVDKVAALEQTDAQRIHHGVHAKKSSVSSEAWTSTMMKTTSRFLFDGGVA